VLLLRATTTVRVCDSSFLLLLLLWVLLLAKSGFGGLNNIHVFATKIASI
jgi:hypothetical protein